MQESIQCGNTQLHKLEEVGARLRRKSVKLDEEIDKINLGVTQIGHANV